MDARTRLVMIDEPGPSAPCPIRPAHLSLMAVVALWKARSASERQHRWGPGQAKHLLRRLTQALDWRHLGPGLLSVLWRFAMHGIWRI
jgi:hypothetical protein